MKCSVCSVSWSEPSQSCPQCHYDHGAPGAMESAAILRARAAFQDRTLAYNPDGRVTRKDKLLPWAGVLLGFVIFVFWLRACTSGGRLW